MRDGDVVGIVFSPHHTQSREHFVGEYVAGFRVGAKSSSIKLSQHHGCCVELGNSRQNHGLADVAVLKEHLATNVSDIKAGFSGLGSFRKILDGTLG